MPTNTPQQPMPTGTGQLQAAPTQTPGPTTTTPPATAPNASGKTPQQLANEILQNITQELKQQPSDFSIVRLIDLIVAHASLLRASDIHIDPSPDTIRVRFRIDGIMHQVVELPKILQSILVSRMKILCGLRTDEHQIPQDGRFKSLIQNIGPVDIRVSIVPTYYGENVEMRLLQTPTDDISLDDLDMSANDLTRLKKAITRPYGMILATGPTGSGKTTMLYGILRTLNTPDVAIITIEDPIEYSIDGIEQIQINPLSGLTFATGLRSILRQDPNIIMVGEIRDEETAEIAVNAALTGHLLLSTLHTNDAATTLARLSEFKIEPFLVSSTVNIAIGQRLVRKICSNCKIEKVVSDAEYQSLLESIPTEILNNNRNFFEGKGCDSCGNSGYQGRTGIYEILVVDDIIREAIMRRANANEIAALAIQNGMTTMLQDGFRKVLEGKTTLEEILRVVHE